MENGKPVPPSIFKFKKFSWIVILKIRTRNLKDQGKTTQITETRCDLFKKNLYDFIFLKEFHNLQNLNHELE